MNIKRIGIYTIQYPTTCNGRVIDAAFVDNGVNSDFVSFYPDGSIGIGCGVKVMNKRVIKYLEKLASGKAIA